MSISTESLARSCARRPWRTVVAWMVAIIAGGAISVTLFGSALTNEDRFTSTPDSMVAEEILEENGLREAQNINEFLIVSSQTLTVDDQAFKDRVNSLTLAVNSLEPGITGGALNYYMIGDESLVSGDRRTTMVPIAMSGELDEAVDNIHLIREIELEADGAGGFQVLLTGASSFSKDFEGISQDDLATEQYAVLIALVVVIIVFRTLGAAPIPMVTAIVAIILAIAAASLIGQAYKVSFFVLNIIFTFGLALGIDYSLFIVGRYREERAAGLEKVEAIAKAGSTATRAVFFSGLTVMLSLIGMLMVPQTIFFSLAMGAILAAIMAILVALTLLPAVLSLMGDRVNAWRVPFLGRGPLVSDDSSGGFWSWITRLVMGQPAVSLLLVVGLLLAATVSMVDMKVGSAGVSTFPDDMRSKLGFEILQREFQAGLISPTDIVIDGPADSQAVAEGIDRLFEMIVSDPNQVDGRPLFGAPERTASSDGSVGLVTVPINADSMSDDAVDAVKLLRGVYVPDSEIPADVYVGGNTAANVDFNDLAKNWTPIVFVFVLSLSFVLLTVVFRSLVVPVKAIIMNLLSVGAAYGLLVLVFQKGVAVDFLGFQQVETIASWLPLFLFSVLFGLSMDYHVMLLSRIRERYDQTGNNQESVAFGLRTTARMITGAALIMVVVFGGFAMADLVMFQQMGFGLGVAIFLDATIVRTVLVPASMRLLGDLNWYFPKFLEWLPDLRVEPSSHR